MIWLFVTAGITTVLALIGLFTQRASGWLLILMIAMIVLQYVFTGLAYIQHDREQNREKQLTRYSGILKNPRSLATTVFSRRQGVYPKMKLGNSDTFFNWQGPQGEPILQFFGDTDILIWIENGQLKVSTVIRGSDGQLIAEIAGNEWKLKEAELWDRNYNENSLEVKNGAGDVVLQVVLNEDYVQLAAKIYSSTGEGLVIGSSELTEEDVARHNSGEVFLIGPEGAEFEVGDTYGVIEIRPPGEALELHIQAMFKYPSELHIGELLNS